MSGGLFISNIELSLMESSKEKAIRRFLAGLILPGTSILNVDVGLSEDGHYLEEGHRLPTFKDELEAKKDAGVEINQMADSRSLMSGQNGLVDYQKAKIGV